MCEVSFDDVLAWSIEHLMMFEASNGTWYTGLLEGRWKMSDDYHAYTSGRFVYHRVPLLIDSFRTCLFYICLVTSNSPFLYVL